MNLRRSAMKGAENGTGSGMTLRRVLELAVSGLLLLLLLGTLSSNLYNLRQYMQAQLQSHAQDAATSLGLSLSTAVDARDLAVAGSVINAIYDSGYYQRIVLSDLDGRPLVVRESDMADRKSTRLTPVTSAPRMPSSA